MMQDYTIQVLQHFMLMVVVVYHIYRNEIHDAPYSGMIIGKTDILAEENLIYRVMREIHDGAAIYAYGVNNCILRGNVVRDITGIRYRIWSQFILS